MDKKLLVVGLLTLVGVAMFGLNQKGASGDAFQEWKQQYGVNWGHEEQAYRRGLFEQNYAKMVAHNADHTQTYKMAINQFSALSDEQFFKLYLDPKPASMIPQVIDDSVPILTQNIDWSSQGKVSKVKNQGNCGSCWAFSATGVMESWALQRGQTVDLSEQQLVDCTGPYGNYGCNGGWPQSAMNYVAKQGLSSQGEYPYTATTGSCAKQGGGFRINGVTVVKGCNGLANALEGRPISVTVDASNWSRYGSGVFNNCGTGINHAVLLVGATEQSWRIKNSWGEGWGESGFIRLSLGNTCGVCIYDSPWPQ